MARSSSGSTGPVPSWKQWRAQPSSSGYVINFVPISLLGLCDASQLRSLVTRLVQWGIPRCEMGQTTMQSLGDLSLNLAGSVKLPYMGNLKKENSHVIAK
jgi:hypothetical protein